MFMQVKKSINNREQGLKILAQSYNREVNVMKTLKDSYPHYHNYVVPKSLDLSNLFQLDVFSAIWDDFGLDEAEEIEPQLWQSDDLVRQGIRAMLELDRCKEEEERLWWEISSLSRWGIHEAQVLANSWINQGKHTYHMVGALC